MKKLIIAGGSSGIGAEILKREIEQRPVVNFSRSSLNFTHPNLKDINLDVTQDEFPDIPEAQHLIYCPGTINLKPFLNLTLADFKTDLEVNLIGAIRFVKAYQKSLKKQKNASILLFSTVAVNQGMPFHASVASAKGAVEGFARAIASEFAPSIRVNVIAPSITNTPLASRLLRNEKMHDKMQQRHPLKRILSAQEVAAMACFLMSEHARGITGQIIGIDAGLSSLRT